MINTNDIKAWRRDHPDTLLYLKDANLLRTYFGTANLEGAKWESILSTLQMMSY
jgi:hypothetical protein